MGSNPAGPIAAANFDGVAPFYGALETIVFANALQRARVALLHHVGMPKTALLVGEANGRFLAAFLDRFPSCRVDVIDVSERMLSLARRRTGERDNVRFLHRDIRSGCLTSEKYDLIVANFVLDCFDERELSIVATHLAECAATDTRWLITEFKISGMFARMLIAVMYAFFCLTTQISGGRLLDYSRVLMRNQFRLKVSREFLGGIVTAEIWQRERV